MYADGISIQAVYPIACIIETRWRKCGSYKIPGTDSPSFAYEVLNTILGNEVSPYLVKYSQSEGSKVSRLFLDLSVYLLVKSEEYNGPTGNASASGERRR